MHLSMLAVLETKERSYSIDGLDNIEQTVSLVTGEPPCASLTRRCKTLKKKHNIDVPNMEHPLHQIILLVHHFRNKLR